MMRLLVSVRDASEALVAARGGADFIDAKEPGRGALGDLPLDTIRNIVERLRDSGAQQPVSATIGDVPMHALAQILERVEAVGACGVDYVKVGIEVGSAAGPSQGGSLPLGGTRAQRARGRHDADAPAVLDALAHCGTPVVPVFIADRGLDPELIAHALDLGFAGVMADTADKRAGSLFDVLSRVALAHFVAQARAVRVMVGLAGALQQAHAGVLAELAPDFAGFRSAVCAGDRRGALDAVRLGDLASALRVAQLAAARVSPSSSTRMRASSAR
jgi:(5-formylfuran-3-yl)methyl phosphate synthase